VSRKNKFFKISRKKNLTLSAMAMGSREKNCHFISYFQK
jgi:hypothetical protein